MMLIQYKFQALAQQIGFLKHCTNNQNTLTAILLVIPSQKRHLNESPL